MVSPYQVAPERIRPLMRVEYDRLVELGVFGDGAPIELLRGSLVRKMTQKPPHADVARRLDAQLRALLGNRALCSCQFPFGATDDSEPEPDIAVVPNGDYAAHHPTEAYLIVEVARASLRLDLEVKASIYAESGVPDYWVVNLPDDVIEVFHEPGTDGYRTHRQAVRGEKIRLVAFPDVELDVDAILPPRR